MSNTQVQLSCPLCHFDKIERYHEDKRREYSQCDNCHLVFVAPDYHLSFEDEKKQYDSHQNSPDDPDYRRFLSRLLNPMAKVLHSNSRGLDFGSGPGPTLFVMFEEAGHSMRLYDPIYAPDPSALERKYDFITASEVVEHLSNPCLELNRLWDCLEDGGHLGIMTKRVINQESFRRWHYAQEPTHICFYSEATFKWLAKYWHAGLTVADKDVVIFHKGGRHE